MTEPGEYTPGFFSKTPTQKPTVRCPDFDRPKFKVKSETLGSDVIANFRVRPEVHASIKKMAEENGVGMADVVRQMIDFSLEFA